MPQQLSTNTFGVAKWIVDATLSNATHSTIAGALTSASSGDTIFIRPGTYTENLTLKAGVNLAAFGSDSSLNGTGKVIISGTLSFAAAGSVTISGIQLQTNGATNILSVTGSAASIVNLQNCYLNCTANTGISFTTANTAANINLQNCTGDLGTTGIGYYSMSSTGGLNIYNCNFTNSGSSLTASSNSAGAVIFVSCYILVPLSTSSAGNINLFNTNVNTAVINTTCVTTAGTGTLCGCTNCSLYSGTASTISIGVNTTFNASSSIISSSNTNAITGAGSLNYQGLSLIGTGVVINTTTQGTAGLLIGGRFQAPPAGFLGEQISATASAVATTSAAAKTIATLALTAGIWDISLCAGAVPTGGTAVMTDFIAEISVTTNTLTGTFGVNQLEATVTGGIQSLSIPSYRVTITASTNYFLVVRTTYTSTTCPCYGRISGTRVG